MGVRSVEELVSYADASGKAELDMKEVVLNQTKALIGYTLDRNYLPEVYFCS